MKYQMLITFPGEPKVNTEFDDFTIKTDQPQSNGSAGSAPTPARTCYTMSFIRSLTIFW